MPYKGPGFYNEMGERVCSLHPESMKEFIDDQGFAHVQNSEEYEYLEEDIVEQQRRDEKNELYGPRKAFHLVDQKDRYNYNAKQTLIEDDTINIKWGGTD